MEMSNATSGGPSQGLFDILFGSNAEDTKKSSEDSKGGEEFDPLLQLVKALDAKAKMVQQSMEKNKDLDAAMSDINPNEIIANEATANEVTTNENIDIAELPIFAEKEPVATMNDDLPIDYVLEQIQKGVGGKPVTAEELMTASKLVLASRNGAKVDNELIAKEMKTVKEQLMQNVTGNNQAHNGFGLENAEAGALGKLAQEIQSKFGGNAPNDAVLQMQGTKINKTSTEDFINMNKAMKQSLAANNSDQNLIQNAVEATSSKFDQTKNMLDQNLPNPSNLNSMENINSALGLNASRLDSTVLNSALSITDTFNVNTTNTQTIKESIMPNLAQNIRFQTVNGGGEMKIMIKPEELGQINIKVKTMGNKANVSLMVDNQEIAKALQSGTDLLKNVLAASQINLSGFDVNVRETNSANFANSNFNDSENSFGSQFGSSDMNGHKDQNEFQQSFKEFTNNDSVLENLRPEIQNDMDIGIKKSEASEVKSDNLVDVKA